jgi:methylated-DNA-[protein]-cysteine S-methyltransferase
MIQCLEQLIQYFQGERRIFELPIHQQGTPFQQEVWNELMTIPYGKTISYLELARKTGDHKATRAVANAEWKKQCCYHSPCHRVIGSNRELIGYGGGYGERNGCLNLKQKWRMECRTLF